VIVFFTKVRFGIRKEEKIGSNILAIHFVTVSKLEMLPAKYTVIA
jgi:hypothetical protein